MAELWYDNFPVIPFYVDGIQVAQIDRDNYRWISSYIGLINLVQTDLYQTYSRQYNVARITVPGYNQRYLDSYFEWIGVPVPDYPVYRDSYFDASQVHEYESQGYAFDNPRLSYEPDKDAAPQWGVYFDSEQHSYTATINLYIVLHRERGWMTSPNYGLGELVYSGTFQIQHSGVFSLFQNTKHSDIAYSPSIESIIHEYNQQYVLYRGARPFAPIDMFCNKPSMSSRPTEYGPHNTSGWTEDPEAIGRLYAYSFTESDFSLPLISYRDRVFDLTLEYFVLDGDWNVGTLNSYKPPQSGHPVAESITAYWWAASCRTTMYSAYIIDGTRLSPGADVPYVDPFEKPDKDEWHITAARFNQFRDALYSLPEHTTITEVETNMIMRPQYFEELLDCVNAVGQVATQKWVRRQLYGNEED